MAMSKPERPLYFMAKPPPALAEVIAASARTDKRRPADLLHTTVLPLIDLARFPAKVLPWLVAGMHGFEADAFRLVFDRIVERRCVTLRGSEPMRGFEAFQVSLISFLEAQGFRLFGRRPEAHITINYRRDDKGDDIIDPISWRVEELLLVESVYGKTKHIPRGRWPLRT